MFRLVPYPGALEQDDEDVSVARAEPASLLGSGRAKPVASFIGSDLAGLGRSRLLGHPAQPSDGAGRRGLPAAALSVP
jgi:hypothetical protein